MVASSEESFLDIGEKLKEFYQRAQEMCGKSSEMVGIMTGEGLSEAIAGLSAILDELKAVHEYTGKELLPDNRCPQRAPDDP